MKKEALLTHWPEVRSDLVELIDGFDQDNLHFVPVVGGWSVGRIMLHIGSAAEYWLHSGILGTTDTYQLGKARLENFSTIQAIKDYLTAEHEMTMNLLKTFDEEQWECLFPYPDGYSYRPSWIFWHVFEHEIHHRGELSLILGLLGREGLDV